jgi:phosphoglycerol transferase MdoB-like AlkP superfamily enzyme
MTEKSDFPKTAHDTKWGAFDHVVLEKALAEQNQSYQPDQPFFTTILTLSSHEPFHVPMKTVIEGTDEPSMFKNSVVYADSALGAFLRAAEQSEWWANTLVVLVADHGHRLPAYLPLHSLGKYKIPMLWLGGALAVQDTQIHTYAQQTDIAATINAQYGWDYSQYKFSKDILNPATKGFGFYTFNDGWGFVENDSNYAVVDNISQQFLEAKGDTARLKNLGRAYLQVLSQDFLDK